MRDGLPQTGRAGIGAAAAAAAAMLALLAIVLAQQAPPQLSAGSESGAGLEADWGSFPLAFEPAPPGAGGADYVARSASGTVSLSGSGADLTLGTGDRADSIRLGLVGASAGSPTALDRLPGVVNDLRGDDPSRWRIEVPTFERVRYPGVYPGVDLEWYGNERRLEYDWRLAPGADPDAIAMRVGGAQGLRIAADGDLVIDMGAATVRHRAPIAYQPANADGARRGVQSEFTLDGNVVGVRLGDYDPQRRVVIDPLVLSYSTYLGGSAADRALGIAVDSSGAAYVTGDTASPDFDTAGPIEGDTAGSDDVFVSKVNPAGSALVYSTYLGGDGDEQGNGIAVDTTGAAYVTGPTDSTDFNTVGPIEGDDVGTDVFVSKLTPAGSALAYSTYLGGNAVDWAEEIAVDGSGAAYVTGFTAADNFPTAGAFEVDPPGIDAFLSRLNPAGGALTYSTYLGGSGIDIGQGVAVDSAGRAYLTGFTDSTDFDTLGPIEGDGDGAVNDAFVSKLDPAVAGAGSLLYSTYLGGTGDDRGAAIAVDSSNSAYVTGLTAAPDFNTAGPVEGDGGGEDAFVSKLNAAGSALAYSTYLGGGADDQGKAIAVDGAGVAHVAGTTESDDFNTVDPLKAYSGGEDPFLLMLNGAGSALGFSTYFGGGADDEFNGLALDASGAVYVAGHSDSDNFETLNQIEGDTAGSTDAVIAKLVAPPAEPPAAEGRCKGETATITGTNGDDDLTGTPGDDVIAPGAGSDTVKGGGGDDVICGSRGKDRLKGAKGKDRIGGGKGKDRVAGGASKDRLGGGKGRDRLRGGGGRDVLRGGPGKDKKKQ